MTRKETPAKIATRFWGKVKKAPGNACWIWQAARCEKGYAHFFMDGITTTAHRVAWILTNGPIASKRIHVLHRCNNGHLGCVRPDHLYLGDYKRNGADMKECGRSQYGQKNFNAKLTEEQAAAIVREYRRESAVKSNRRELAARYGIDPKTASAIGNGRAWKHLRQPNR